MALSIMLAISSPILDLMEWVLLQICLSAREVLLRCLRSSCDSLYARLGKAAESCRVAGRPNEACPDASGDDDDGDRGNLDATTLALALSRIACRQPFFSVHGAWACASYRCWVVISLSEAPSKLTSGFRNFSASQASEVGSDASLRSCFER